MGKLKDSEVVTKNTTELLYRLNKTAYSNLKGDHEKFGYLFNLGETLGEKDINKEELRIKAEITRELLDSLLEKSKTVFIKIKKKIDSYKKVELAFQLITALGGSALLITLTNAFEEDDVMNQRLQFTGAIIATAGSLLSVFLNRGLGAWSFNRRNRVEDYDKLVNANLVAGKLVRNLDPKLQVFDTLTDYEELIAIINETEDLSNDIGNIIADYH